MRPSTFALIVAGVAVAVPVVVIAFGQSLTRYAKWAEARPARRRIVCLATAGVYLAIGLFGLISHEAVLTGWIFFFLALLLVLAAWYEARHPGSSGTLKP